MLFLKFKTVALPAPLSSLVAFAALQTEKEKNTQKKKFLNYKNRSEKRDLNVLQKRCRILFILRQQKRFFFYSSHLSIVH